MIISPRASEHCSQIVSGFILLKKQKLIDLKIIASDQSFTSMVEVIINNSIRVVYDMADGYHFDLDSVKDYLLGVDYIFKRSYREECHSDIAFCNKIHPLGLNYHVTTKNNPLDKWKEKGKIIKLTKWYIKELMGLNYHQKFYVENFEDLPRLNNEKPTILLSARTWGPSDDARLVEEETMIMNKMRADCIRMLRSRFGSKFIGGFTPRKEAIELYPDCLLDSSVTDRDNFLHIMKHSDICISTIGLHKSNGWKLGEYVAASKGIVSEKLYYYVPHFMKNINYLEFTTPYECIEQVEALVNDSDKLFQMKKDNYQYYINNLRPDKIVLNTLVPIIYDPISI